MKIYSNAHQLGDLKILQDTLELVQKLHESGDYYAHEKLREAMKFLGSIIVATEKSL